MNLLVSCPSLSRPAGMEARRPGFSASPTGPGHSRDDPHLIGSLIAPMRLALRWVLRGGVRRVMPHLPDRAARAAHADDCSPPGCSGSTAHGQRRTKPVDRTGVTRRSSPACGSFLRFTQRLVAHASARDPIKNIGGAQRHGSKMHLRRSRSGSLRRRWALALEPVNAVWCDRSQARGARGRTARWLRGREPSAAKIGRGRARTGHRRRTPGWGARTSLALDGPVGFDVPPDDASHARPPSCSRDVLPAGRSGPDLDRSEMTHQGRLAAVAVLHIDGRPTAPAGRPRAEGKPGPRQAGRSFR